MLSTIIMVVVVFLCVIFIIFYKREMLLRVVSGDITSSTYQFQEQLEETGDIVIKRLEEQVLHLENLLEEANQKIMSLDNKLQDVSIFLEKEKNTIVTELNDTKMMIVERATEEYNKHLEEQHSHFEQLLNEADQKNESLKCKIQDTIHHWEKENSHINEKIVKTRRMISEIDNETHHVVNSNAINNIAIATDQIAKLSLEDYKDMARNDKRGSIIAMDELGYDVGEIAKTTGISKGEIMLLLQLNKK